MPLIRFLILIVVLVSQACVGNLSIYLLTCIEANTSLSHFLVPFWALPPTLLPSTSRVDQLSVTGSGSLHFLEFSISEITRYALVILPFSTQHNDLGVHPCCGPYYEFIPFCSQVGFFGMWMYHRFVCLFASCWTFGWGGLTFFWPLRIMLL